MDAKLEELADLRRAFIDMKHDVEHERVMHLGSLAILVEDGVISAGRARELGGMTIEGQRAFLRESLGAFDPIADVKAFHEKMGLPVETSPVYLEHARANLRGDLIKEEADEAYDALIAGSLEHQAKEICDSIYVGIGAALEAGLPIPEAWAEVHRTNMLKEPGNQRADGKILKPEGWEPPNLTPIINAALESES